MLQKVYLYTTIPKAPFEPSEGFTKAELDAI